MSKTRVLLQPAYILHSRPYRDTSALVEIFTPQFGRLGLIARGVRGAVSKRRSTLQPFSPMLVSWSGKGELSSLNSVESQGRALLLKADALSCGLYVNELLVRLTHRAEPHIELFSIYDTTLRRLNELQSTDDSQHTRLQQILRQFEIELLSCLGYGLNLGQEALGQGEVRSELVYDFQLENGPVLYHEANQEIYGFKISGKTLLALAHNKLDAYSGDLVVYREAKHLLRFVLDRYLGNKPLMSRQLLRKTPAISTSES